MPFERVVAHHSVTVLRVCRAIVGPHDADDAWSETFLSAMRTYPDLPDNANVEAWLVTIAHRKSIDIVRKQKRINNTRAVEREERANITASDATNRELWDLIRSLPDKQRHAVAYHYLGGLRYVEVAQIIGGTTDAARRAAADGIRNLRRTFIDVEPKGA